MGDVWDDLREDARKFAGSYPAVGHTLVFVPDRTAEGASAIDVEAAGPDDFAAMAMKAQDAEAPARALGLGHPGSRIFMQKPCPILDGTGFVSELLWCNSVRGVMPNAEVCADDWKRLCAKLWQLAATGIVARFPVAAQANEVEAPPIGTQASVCDTGRLLHWLAWSAKAQGLRATVNWQLCFRPNNESELAELERYPTAYIQRTFPDGRPARPTLPNKPWLEPAGWWWSTIEDAGSALVAAIGWLRPESKTHTPTDPLERESLVSRYSKEHPQATAAEMAKELGIPKTTLQRTTAWQIHNAAKKQATKARRQTRRGSGGVADPSVL